MKKMCFVIGLISLISGCGQGQSASGGQKLNSLYISLTQQFNESDSSNTIYLFNEGTDTLNYMTGENIIFHPPTRPTTIQFGDLDTSLLGYTECLYNNDGTSGCTITISNTINPDVYPAQENTFRGVLKHEIGHAFGMGHIKDDDNNVMYPVFYDKQTLPSNLQQYIINLTNFRENGINSGLSPITTKWLNGSFL
jgi:hypothetical protein